MAGSNPSVANGPPARPLLLSILMWYALIMGFGGLTVALGGAAGLVSLPFGGPAEPFLPFLREAWPGLVSVIWLSVLALGLAFHARWTRLAATLWWAGTCVALGLSYGRDFTEGGAQVGLLLATEFSLLFWVVAAVWYFYRKQAVVAYYAKLRSAAA